MLVLDNQPPLHAPILTHLSSPPNYPHDQSTRIFAHLKSGTKRLATIFLYGHIFQDAIIHLECEVTSTFLLQGSTSRHKLAYIHDFSVQILSASTTPFNITVNTVTGVSDPNELGRALIERH